MTCRLTTPMPPNLKGVPTTIRILLLLALPASGKSEISRYLKTLSSAGRADGFGFGRLIELDDYPYVHLMRRISAELRRFDGEPVFFGSDSTPFLDSGDWGTLIHLINEDYANLGTAGQPDPRSAARWLLGRLQRARRAAGLDSPFGGMTDDVRASLILSVEEDARRLWRARRRRMAEDPSGATVVIEFARGGPEGAAFPLPDAQGYRYSLSRLSPEILVDAAILYVWVTPEESRRRNVERAWPGRRGDESILHHGVPEAVMRQDYGTDDLMWLIEHSDVPGTVRVEAHGTVYHLPVAVLDNREDKTSFLRAEPETWSDEAVGRLHRELKDAFEKLTVASAVDRGT